MTNLVSVGISHNTAPIGIREAMWMSVDETKEALKLLKEKYFSEVVLVSTCNRTEVYGLAQKEPFDENILKSFLIDFKAAQGNVHLLNFYENFAGGAVNHLFKVAAGVDSMVMGDIQILGQVKEAFQLSVEMGMTGPVMNRLMQSTLHVAKRVRSETAICEGAVSISYAAVELASKIFADLSKKSALLIGAGETGELTLKHLLGRGIGQVKIANRTRERAEALLTNLGVSGEVVDYDRLNDAVRSVDIVITSVNSPTYIVQPRDVLTMMKQRSNNPLFLIDIGVPRNVDPACKKAENVFVYDIDSLNTIIDRNLERRKAEIPKVSGIIREEIVEFTHWYNSLQVGPTIQEFRQAFEVIRDEEVRKNINRFKPEDRELVDMITKRIINKILHQPITSLKAGAENGNGQQETITRISTLRELFGLTQKKQETDGN